MDLFEYYNRGFIELDIPYNLESLCCFNNNIIKLDIPNTLYILYCYHNNINELKLTDNLVNLCCDIFVDVKNINNKELCIKFW